MTSARVCPKCGTVIGGFGAVGLCPKCLLLSGLELPEEEVSPGPEETSRPRVRYFGDYELLEEVASGGMGVVYKARQKSLNRLVAVKLLLFGRFSQPEFVKRFRAEAAAAGRLQHPNIVAIHEVGEHEGQPYFSMDFVEGSSLAEMVQKGPLPAKQAALYLKLIADAIHFAHQKGVLHRDLKPSNVLIDQFDQPRITDFGLAKQLNDQDELTLTGQVLGSPGYMPPEQAKGRRDAMGPASDVYSMGAVLYQLLTSRPPFVSESIPETLDQVLHSEPVSPRLLNPGVPRDLETICLKCLEKEPARRYASARELSEELDRFLRDEPIQAHPVGLVHRAWRWSRRHSAIAAMGAVVILLLVLVALTSTVAALRIARAERGRIEKLRQSYLAQAQAQRHTTDAGRRFRALDALREAARLNPPADMLRELRSEAIASLAMVDVRPARVWPFKSEAPPHVWVFDRSFDCYAYLAKEPTEQVIYVKRAADDTQLARVPLGTSEFAQLSALSEDGRFVVAQAPGPRHRVYDARNGRPALTNEIAGYSVEFPGGTNLLAGRSPGGQLTLWDVATGSIVRAFETPRNPQAFAFSPDGSRLATANERQVAVRDAQTGRTIFSHTLPLHPAKLAWSGDNTRLIAVSSDRQAVVWRADTGEEIKILFGAAGGVIHAAVHSGTHFVLTTELDRTLRVWDLIRAQPLIAMTANTSGARFSTDGQRFGPLWAGYDLMICELVPPVGYQRLAPDTPRTRFGQLAWSPQGGLLALATAGRVQLWDVQAGRALGSLDVPALSANAQAWWKVNQSRPVLFDGTGSMWAEGGEELVRWPMRHTDLEDREIRAGPPELVPFAALSNQWSHAPGAWVARGLVDAKRSEISSGNRKAEPQTTFASVSPDNRYLVTLEWMDFATARVRDRKTGETITTLPTKSARALQFSPDGRWLVTAGQRYEIWDVHRWVRALTIEHGTEEMIDGWAEFSPDGRTLALVQSGRQVDLRMANSWKSIARLDAPDGIRIEQIRFSPDGTRLAASGREGSVQVWDLRRIGEELAGLGLAWPLALPKSHDSRSADIRPLRLKVIVETPRREASAPRQLINLSDDYNARLDERWFGQRWTLSGMEPGLKTFDEVKFDVRGVVQLSAADGEPGAFPAEVRGIGIHQSLGQMHFLHGCINRIEPGSVVGRYIVQYADGRRVEIPVAYGQEVRDAFFMRNAPTQATNATIAWESPCDEIRDGAVRLFHSKWINPRPETEIQKVDFVSALNGSAPFLVAITVE